LGLALGELDGLEGQGDPGHGGNGAGGPYECSVVCVFFWGHGIVSLSDGRFCLLIFGIDTDCGADGLGGGADHQGDFVASWPEDIDVPSGGVVGRLPVEDRVVSPALFAAEFEIAVEFGIFCLECDGVCCIVADG